MVQYGSYFWEMKLLFLPQKLGLAVPCAMFALVTFVVEPMIALLVALMDKLSSRP